MSVSAVIPTYNCSHLLPEAIESALGQSHKLREVIVVDDGSTDETEKCVRPFLSEIRYIRQENRGLAGARNRGIQESQGEFVAFLDADDLWLNEKTAKQLRAFEASPSAALTFTDAYVLSPTGEAMPNFTFGKAAGEGQVFSVLLHTQFMLPSTVMVRRVCFEDIGLFDEGLRCVEDLDLWLRISRKYPVKMVAEPLAVWRRQDRSLSTQIVSMSRGSIQVYRKWLPKSSGLSAKEMTEVKNQISRCYFEIGFALRDQNKLSALWSLTLSLWWNTRDSRNWRALLSALIPATVRNHLKAHRIPQRPL